MPFERHKPVLIEQHREIGFIEPLKMLGRADVRPCRQIRRRCTMARIGSRQVDKSIWARNRPKCCHKVIGTAKMLKQFGGEYKIKATFSFGKRQNIFCKKRLIWKMSFGKCNTVVTEIYTGSTARKTT